MTWPTAIAALLRFYKGGISYTEVWDMPLLECLGMIQEIGNVVELETGEEPKRPVSLSGEKAFAVGKTIMPRGKGWGKK